MHDEDAHHPNSTLQQKLEHIYQLRREGGRVNFEDATHYQKLLAAFGNPHLNLPPVIHIAGTNGKGSTLATLRSIYETAGYRVHAYTSPHLKVFNERIYLADTLSLRERAGERVLKGSYISDPDLEALLDETFAKNGAAPVTFFEFTTAMAFAAFARTPADFVLLETGMGGRLDCTNAVPRPAATIVTQIAYDHMEFLGDTLPKIAAEKAGIMKQGVPCFIAPQTTEAVNEGVLDVFRAKAAQLDCPFYIAGQDWTCRPSPDGMTFQIPKSSNPQITTYPKPNLLGPHQIDNTGTAIATAQILQDMFHLPARSRGFAPAQAGVKQEQIATALQKIHWPGRMERLTDSPLNAILPDHWQLWFDGGHNPAAAHVVAAQLALWQQQDPRPLHIFLGMKEGKDIDTVEHILLPHATTLSRVKIGQDLSPLLIQLVGAGRAAPARVLICGSFYNYC